MTARPAEPPPHGERGSLAIEAALVVPVLLMMLTLILAAGRAQQLQGTLDEAARTGARAGTLAAPGGETDAATAAVKQTLQQSGVRCDGLVITPVVEPLKADPTLRDVAVQVDCTLQVNDLSPVWVPAALKMQLHGTFRSVIDQYRST
jgi:Flp pilus assembly protein TadG